MFSSLSFNTKTRLQKGIFSPKIAWLMVVILFIQSITPHIFLCLKDGYLHFKLIPLSCCNASSSPEDINANATPCEKNKECSSHCSKNEKLQSVSQVPSLETDPSSCLDCCVSIVFYPDIPQKINTHTFLYPIKLFLPRLTLEEESLHLPIHWPKRSAFIYPPPPKITLFSTLLL